MLDYPQATSNPTNPNPTLGLPLTLTLTPAFPPYVVFSIDNVSDVYTLSKFLRYMDNKKVMKALHDPSGLVLAMGSYMGELEQSFILDKRDFYELLSEGKVGHFFVQDQECVMVVQTGHNNVMYCNMHYANKGIVPMGQLIEVDVMTAYESGGWTYRADTMRYYTCKPINPATKH